MLKRLFSIVLLCAGLGAQAQELNCKVQITRAKITGVDNEVFNTMQRAITEFMNAHKWTTDEFATNEKIDCNIFINLTANKLGGDPDVYSATLSIQASRPVFSAAYTSTTVNYVDRDFAFKFNQFTALNFDDNRVSGTEPLSSNLTAVLAYYAYIIVGLDYDSFAPDGGTNYFKRAQNIVNNAPESGKSISGWKAAEGTRNRYWLVDQLLNSRFHDVRTYWYTMHRECLDSMYTRPTEARGRMLNNLKKLTQVNRENPSSMLLQFFFAAKSAEFLNILTQTGKPERAMYIPMLTALDVPNAPKYSALK